ncbi:MAG TPA: hypothetical protein VJR47_07665 [Stellaceae bacterium]|nr:hypothetical protein [Stellaceae bacterium]
MAEPLGASLPVNPTGGIDPRLHQGVPVNAIAPHHDGSSGAAQDSSPSTEFHLGTTIAAVVRGPPAENSGQALPVGTQLLLRILALPAAPQAGLLIGRVVESGGGETLVDTPFGLLALERKLALPPGTLFAFERLEEIAPDLADAATPSRVGGWPALEEALGALAPLAPELAARLRAMLSPASGSQLAGSLLFLLGGLYGGDWPGSAVGAALAAGGLGKLAQRLSDDAAELRRLGADPATGDWRVLTLPLLAGPVVLPLRLFMRRPKPVAQPEESTRFAIEVELSRLGPLQLDGLLRGTHLILVVRSHRGLSAELRADATAIYRKALRDWSLSGDLSFATAAAFALAPLSGLRKHIEVKV